MLAGCKIQNPINISAIYSFFNRIYPEGYFFKGEAHDFYEVVCVLNGEVGITAGNNVFVLKSGEMTFHPPSEFHAIWREGATPPEVVIFSFSALPFPSVNGKIFALDDKEISVIKLLMSDFNKIFDTSDDINVNITIKQSKNNEAILFTKRLEAFLIEVFSSSEIFKSAYSSQSSTLFSKILSVMEDNLSSSLNLSDIASLCGVSIPTLEKTVYKYLGYGAQAHYNTLRMQKALTLLLGGSNVNEVAVSLGFSNQCYFSARFKKFYGYPPSKAKNNAYSVEE
jgi:AraC-like DNA-binding protein